MGYNSWYDFNCNLNQEDLEGTVRALHSHGLIDLGYTYFNLDDCWAGGREPNGTIYAEPSSFPSRSLKPLADYAHSFGMKFGTYTCRGDKTCASRPGSLGHERIDAETYALWGVDYLKEDSCFTQGDNHSLAIEQYSLMRDSLNATGRPIFFSLCGWFPWYAEFSAALGNAWRIGLDDSNWLAVLSNIDTNANLAQHAGPGEWLYSVRRCARWRQRSGSE
jgi:alpha-galactosidase